MFKNILGRFYGIRVASQITLEKVDHGTLS